MKTKPVTHHRGAHARFKALAIGEHFTGSDGATHRKASARGAFRLLPNGTGQTNRQIPIARNAWVIVA